MAVRNRQKHLGETAKLKFELIKTESNTVLRKKNVYIYTIYIYMRHFIFVKKSP